VSGAIVSNAPPAFVLEGVSGAAASSFSVTVTGTPVERTFLAAVRRRILDSVTEPSAGSVYWFKRGRRWVECYYMAQALAA
jgi:hypothetical protein